MRRILQSYFRMKLNRDEEEWCGFANIVHTEDASSYPIKERSQKHVSTIGEVG